jgi:hypothetical protein
MVVLDWGHDKLTKRNNCWAVPKLAYPFVSDIGRKTMGQEYHSVQWEDPVLAKGARRPFAPASGCVFAPDSRSRPPPHGVPGQKNLAHKSSTKNLRISENLKPRTVTARNLLILL